MIAVVVALLLRGGGSDTAKQAPAMAEALGYSQFDATGVLAVDTSAPLPGLVAADLAPALSGRVLRPEDLSPLQGGAAVATLPDARAPAPTLAVVSRDADAPKQVVEGRHLAPAGSYRGAALYQAGNAVIAVRGRVLLAGASAQAVRAALDTQADPHARMDPASFARRLGSLNRRAPVRLVLRASDLIATRLAAAAKRSPWLRAIRDAAATLSSQGQDVVVRAHIATDEVELTPGDLPFAPGPQTPQIRTNEPAALGVRGVPQLLALLRALDPAGFADLDAPDTFIPGILGVDLGDLQAGLTGDSTLSTNDLHHYILRAQPPDTGAWRTALDRLDKLTDVLGFVGVTDIRIDNDGPGKRVTRNGRLLVRVAVIGPVVVVTNDPRVDFNRVAAAPPAPKPPAARGGLAVLVRAGFLRRYLLTRVPGAGPLAQFLGDLTGWAQSALTGVDLTLRARVGQ